MSKRNPASSGSPATTAGRSITSTSVPGRYHGVSLLRRLLGITFEYATVTGGRFTSPIVQGPGRKGPPEEERIIDNLEGAYLKGILCGDSWVYCTPFAPGRLSDDEIAIADCLRKMSDYVDGGPDFYSLPEACQDTYLGLMIGQAILSGDPVLAEAQPWAD
jgi:hypothetical protein